MFSWHAYISYATLIVVISPSSRHAFEQPGLRRVLSLRTAASIFQKIWFPPLQCRITPRFSNVVVKFFGVVYMPRHRIDHVTIYRPIAYIFPARWRSVELWQRILRVVVAHFRERPRITEYTAAWGDACIHEYSTIYLYVYTYTCSCQDCQLQLFETQIIHVGVRRPNPLSSARACCRIYMIVQLSVHQRSARRDQYSVRHKAVTTPSPDRAVREPDRDGRMFGTAVSISEGTLTGGDAATSRAMYTSSGLSERQARIRAWRTTFDHASVHRRTRGRCTSMQRSVFAGEHRSSWRLKSPRVLWVSSRYH